MKKSAELTCLLDFMEENIDIDHIREIEQLQYDAVNYKNIIRLPLTVCTKVEGFQQIPPEEAFYNPELMLYNEILTSTVHSSYNSVKAKDDGPLMIRANHGIGIIASMFGCKSIIIKNQMPWVSPLGLDDAKKVFSKGIPCVKTALGKRVIETYQYYHERLKSFPKCYEAIRITQPDLQGPFNIINLILGKDAYLLPYDDPDLLREMLTIISDTYIQFRKELNPILTDKIKDAVFVHGFCCGGKVLIKADNATANLSSNMYKEFEHDPQEYIFSAFKKQGGGSLHYCGGSKSWHNETVYSDEMRCINYGNPELQNLVENYLFFKKKKVAIVGWGNTKSYDEVKKDFIFPDSKKPIRTGVTLMCKTIDISQAIETVKRHRDFFQNHAVQ